MEKDENETPAVNKIILSFGWTAFIGGFLGMLFTFANTPPVQTMRDFLLVVATYALPTIVALLGLLLIAIERIINHLYTLNDKPADTLNSSDNVSTNPPQDVP